MSLATMAVAMSSVIEVTVSLHSELTMAATLAALNWLVVSTLSPVWIASI
ncbi:MAG: hypothetical protein K2Y22_15475 [Candidatus Obscuribacterales bacterium]|nr:hypothetical protein [Candidatus Obscuribacterales bacterium]